jgi:DNA-binding CsgD family transcriptional regulator
MSAMPDLSTILNNTGVGVCVINNDGIVIYQNDLVASSCANTCGKECTAKNHILCKYVDSFTEGTVRIPIQQIHGKYYDVIGVGMKDYRMVYLVPIQSDKVDLLQELEASALTSKEKEVAALMIAEFSREEIARVLHVSENTIKTHIKNIYLKIPAKISELIRGKAPSNKLANASA